MANVRQFVLGRVSKLRIHRAVLLGVLGALVTGVVIVGVVVALVAYHREEQRKLANGEIVKCSNTLLSKAESQIYQKQLSPLKTTVQKIQQIPNYEQDPNCLYVIVTYYVDLSDPDNAGKYYAAMDKVEPATPKFNSILKAQVITMSDLKSQIAGLQQLQKQAASNSKALDE